MNVNKRCKSFVERRKNITLFILKQYSIMQKKDNTDKVLVMDNYQ